MDMSAKKARNPIKQMMRREINLEPGCEIEICRAVEDAILDNGLPVYVKAGMLVEAIEADTLVEDQGKYISIQNVRLLPITVQRMKHIMSETCLFQKWDKKQKDFVPAATPIDIAYLILARIGHWPFPEVVGVMSCQSIDEQGNIIVTEGVHRRSGLLFCNLPKLPPIPEHPTRADALKALRLLDDDLLGEFSFAKVSGDVDVSRSVALSALISPVALAAVDYTPLHTIHAPAPGSGKSYLIALASKIATGKSCPAVAATDTPEEFEKRLGAALLRAPIVLNLDNLNGTLRSALLCQVLSEEQVDFRILGLSVNATLTPRGVIFANGNHITVAEDLTRRNLLSKLDTKLEHPEEKEYKQRPLARIDAARGKYVAAILTILKAYLDARRPKRPTPPLNGFEQWSNLVRGALIWLGYPDPCLSMKEGAAVDPARRKLAALHAVWPSGDKSKGENGAFTASELIALSLYEPPLAEVLSDVTRGKLTSVTLGRYLEKACGPVVDGLTIAKDGTRQGVTLWRRSFP